MLDLYIIHREYNLVTPGKYRFTTFSYDRNQIYVRAKPKHWQTIQTNGCFTNLLNFLIRRSTFLWSEQLKSGLHQIKESPICIRDPFGFHGTEILWSL